MNRWVSVLSGPWAIPVVVLMGVLLYAPSLNAGFLADDFLQWALIQGEITQTRLPGSLLGLFNLADGDEAHVQAMRDAGRLMWSASDGLRMHFWRPLAEVSHWLDYQLWPGSPMLMHAHSLLWYGLLLLALGHMYRQVLAAPVQGGLALSFYALSGLHGMAIVWLSARNQLMSACFTALTILLYHQWRSGQGVARGWLAGGALVLALACAEASVAAMGYLVAYALTMEHGRPLMARARALLPFLLIIVAWRVAYNVIGYGSLGSGSYVDPVQEPMRFIELVLVRLPALLVAPVFNVPSSTASRLAYEIQALYALGAVAAIAGLAWWAHRLGLWASAQMRFFSLGALLALVPACSIAPQDRVLIHAEIGLFAALSLFCCRVIARWRQDRRTVSVIGKWVVSILMVSHLVVAPTLGAAGAALTGPMSWPSTFGLQAALPASAGHPDVRVVFINPPVPNLLFYYPLTRAYMGLPNPRSMWSLTNGMLQDLRLEVLDASTLRLSSSKAFVDLIHRDTRTLPFKVGDVVRLDGLTITVEQVSQEGGPLAATFRFASPMHGPSWQFYTWEGVSYVPFRIPAPGTVIAFPAADPSRMFKETWRQMLAGQASHPPPPDTGRR